MTEAEEVEVLKSRVAELEGSLKRTRAAFATALCDVLSSFPARATSVESGAVSPPVLHHSTRIEICFGRRFPTSPKVTCWVVLRGDDESDPALFRLKPSSVTATDRLATIFIPADIAAAAAADRRLRATVYWSASCAPVVNARMSAAIQAVFSSPPKLEPSLVREIKACKPDCASGINEPDRIGQTLLHAASCTGNVGLVSWLLKKGADVDAADGQGWTPFLAAISAGQADAARLLLRKSASVHVTCERGLTCLHLVCRWQTFTKVQETLVREIVHCGGAVNVVNDSGETPLLYLLRKNRAQNILQLAELLLELHADPSVADNTGVVPLHVAAAANSVPLAKLLLSHGADTRARGPEGTPVHVAMRKRSKDILRLLAGPVSFFDPEHLEKVLRLLGPVDLHRAMQVSKVFQRTAAVVSDDPSYWYDACGASKEAFLSYFVIIQDMRRALAKRVGSAGDFAVRPWQAADQPALRLVVAVQGAAASGKSCFITRFCERRYDQMASVEMEKYLDPAHPSQFGHMRAMASLRGKPAEIVLVEVPSPMSSAVKAADAFWGMCTSCIILVDATKKCAIDNAKHLAWQWRSSCRDWTSENAILVATKTDLDHRGYVAIARQ